MYDIMKIVKSLEDSGLLLTKTNENKTKQQRSGSLSMLLGTLSVTLLRNILSRKGVIRVGDGVIRAGNGMKKRKYF